MRDSEEGGTARTINDIYGDDARASEDGRGRGMDLRRKGRARTELERFAAVHADALLRSAYLMGGAPLAAGGQGRLSAGSNGGSDPDRADLIVIY